MVIRTPPGQTYDGMLSQHPLKWRWKIWLRKWFSIPITVCQVYLLYDSIWYSCRIIGVWPHQPLHDIQQVWWCIMLPLLLSQLPMLPLLPSLLPSSVTSSATSPAVLLSPCLACCCFSTWTSTCSHQTENLLEASLLRSCWIWLWKGAGNARSFRGLEQTGLGFNL